MVPLGGGRFFFDYLLGLEFTPFKVGDKESDVLEGMPPRPLAEVKDVQVIAIIVFSRFLKLKSLGISQI